jgi:plastocyanin
MKDEGMQEGTHSAFAAHITRRRLMGLIAATGAAAGMAPLLGSHAAAQSGTPVATPVPGPRADGTNLWKVLVGGMDAENGLDLQAFFPSEITVNAGDAIYFEFAPMGMPGFHTVTFTSGDPVPALFVPDVVEGTPVASPQGPPRLIINPEVAWPDGRDTYDGTGLLNSGIDVFRADAGPYVVTFTTPGSYDYQCVPHAPVMKAKVIVQEAGTDLPKDQAAYDAQAQDEVAALIEEGKAAIAAYGQGTATPSAGGATTWEAAAGLGGMSQVRAMLFAPRELTVKVGDTVRWTNMTPGEPHTVTFLGGDEQPTDSIVEPQPAGPPKIVQSYETFLPSGDQEFDGNGYRNSGFMGMPPEVNDMFGLVGDTWELTFTAAGEYPYYCVLHASGPDATEGMVGKVIVTA